MLDSNNKKKKTQFGRIVYVVNVNDNIMKKQILYLKGYVYLLKDQLLYFLSINEIKILNILFSAFKQSKKYIINPTTYK